MNSHRAFNLLVVDDDPLVHQTLKLMVQAPWRVFSVQKLELLSIDRFFHVALVDMHLEPDRPEKASGLKVIKQITDMHPQTEIVAISGDLRQELMEECLKVGAQKFLAKPFSNEELNFVLSKVEALWDLRSLQGQSQGLKWVGSGQSSQKVLKEISLLRGESKPVLIEGETGTGKEVTARLLHQQEESRPFVSVNIAGIPDNLFESEFFGHIKGAFTGADQNKMGLAEAANGGDLFIDEIEALPLHHQVKLLRFLESGEVRKVGSKESFLVNCRVIAASNRPLAEMVKSKEFREDLYFRLCAHRVQLPPLRERTEDIPQLAQSFIESERPRRNKSFSAEALTALQAYHWPGNVRELKRICEQLSLISPLPIIRDADVYNLLPRALGAPAPSTRIDLSQGLTKALQDYERDLIFQVLQKESDVKVAAQMLKISTSNLYKKIDDYDLKEYLK